MIGLLVVVLVTAAAGMAVGYLAGDSALFADSRARRARARDVLDAALHDELGLLGEGFDSNPEESDPPFGMVEVDLEVLPEVPAVPSPRQRMMWRWKWRWYFMSTCAVCAGWWGCAGVLAVWSVVAWAGGGAAPVSWAAALPVWLAASGVHTLATGWSHNN